jgi:hypothetical protein
MRVPNAAVFHADSALIGLRRWNPATLKPVPGEDSVRQAKCLPQNQGLLGTNPLWGDGGG